MKLTAADIRWYNTWSASRYEPATGRLYILGNAPEYTHAHERAHRDQHVHRTYLYRLWEFWHDEPWKQYSKIARLLRLLLELDADLRARRDLRARGLWTEENQKASHLVLLSYLNPARLSNDAPNTKTRAEREDSRQRARRV